MALISKPVNLSLTWASGGDVLNPGDTKYATGWQVEIPPRQWFNYLDNRQDTALAHINQHGVVAWDSVTEYQANKSYVQGTTTGVVYRSKQTHINQDPELDVGEVYWEFAFASPGDFYTKVQADALYLAKASNLADLPNTATARTNLSVYSQAQTYTKTEVDGKTTPASALQSQAQVSNTVLITPLSLATAFQGGNQSLATNGFQRLPGGLIIQWGQVAHGAATDSLVIPSTSFPTTFPTSCVYVDVITNSGATTTDLNAISSSSFGWQIFHRETGGSIVAGTAYWFAVGF